GLSSKPTRRWPSSSTAPWSTVNKGTGWRYVKSKRPMPCWPGAQSTQQRGPSPDRRGLRPTAVASRRRPTRLDHFTRWWMDRPIPPTGRTGFGSHTPARWPVTGRPTRPGRNRCHMYVTITHGPHHPTTVYGPIDDRHTPAAAVPEQSAITVPLHAAGAVTDISTVLPSVSRISRRTATAIAHATPA